ncbi:hypothetical protein AX16_009187 [Volvariella volvacea WC 439]|nr:hypothetical protein AX16_009187 [Volvariella volvacea WC 439]
MSAIPTTQKALLVNSPKGNIVVTDTDVYTPGAGELLVKVRSAALNPVDWKIQRGNFFVKDYPAILGTDVAGDVVKIGEGITKFKVGDRVFFQGSYVNRYATFQQYTLADQAVTAKIPENVSYDEASTIMVAFNCAYLSFYHKLGLIPPTQTHGGAGKYPNIPFVIIGGSSSVGQYAIQLAKLSGFSPIITYASSKHEAFLKSLGATFIIDRQTVSISSLPSAVRAITGSATIPWVFDAISETETQQAGYDILNNGGRLGIVLPASPTLKEQKGSGKQLLHVLGTRDDPLSRHLVEDVYLFIEEWIRNGTIKPNLIEVLPGGLEGIESGLRRLEANQVSGIKLVARLNED